MAWTCSEKIRTYNIRLEKVTQFTKLPHLLYAEKGYNNQVKKLNIEISWPLSIYLLNTSPFSYNGISNLITYLCGGYKRDQHNYLLC